MTDFWKAFGAAFLAFVAAGFVMHQVRKRLGKKSRGCGCSGGAGQQTGNYVNPGNNANMALQANSPAMGGKKNWGRLS